MLYDNMVLAKIVAQHAEETGFLWSQRSLGAVAAQFGVKQLVRHDARIDAHVDGLLAAGEQGWEICKEGLDTPSAGAVFTAALLALHEGRVDRLDSLLALVEAVPEISHGLVSAFGWVESKKLQGIGATLLGAESPFRARVGLAACAMHRVDPGLVSGRWIRDGRSRVRARALRAAGELGVTEVAPACVAAVDDEDPECSFWGTWSAVLLGDRRHALQTLAATSTAASCDSYSRFALALQAMEASAGHAWLSAFGADPANQRWLIRGAGIVGGPSYVEWLIGKMRADDTARVAGESFSLITGVNISTVHLERERPEGVESGPTDDPEDENVAMDPDDNLPWPDADKAEMWWNANASRFQEGPRYFMGHPVSSERCIDVLKNGSQPQRLLAAQYLSLRDPGTPLFNLSAPAWCQQRLLAKMG